MTLQFSPATPAIGGQEVEESQAVSHTVVRGETLWALARRYFGNPFEWRAIHEANRSLISNPHWIYPGQVLAIPSPEGAVMGMEIRPQGLPEALGEEEVSSRRAFSGRTVFYGDPTRREEEVRIMGPGDRPFLALPPDIFYSAGWLEQEDDAPSHVGVIEAFSAPEVRRSKRTTARAFEPVRIRFSGGQTLDVGEEVVSFRITRRLGDHGYVAHPTGTLTVSRLEEAGVVAVVDNEFARVMLGDFVVPAPAYELSPNHRTAPAEAGVTATIIGFREEHELQSLGDVAFLDLGSGDGIGVGDEFVVVVGAGAGWSGETQGRLQVVGVQAATAAARIVEVSAPVFVPGLTVRLDKRMR
jgi:hypothetical protein